VHAEKGQCHTIRAGDPGYPKYAKESRRSSRNTDQGKTAVKLEDFSQKDRKQQRVALSNRRAQTEAQETSETTMRCQQLRSRRAREWASYPAGLLHP
jgi:hypothetical protein